MSDPRTLTAIVLLLVASASPFPARAQEGARSGTAALADSAVRVMEEAAEARRAERRQEEARAERLRREAGLDTVRAGPLRILVPRGQSETAARLWGEAWESLSPQLDHTASSLEQDTFVFQWSPRLLEIPARGPRVESVGMRTWHPEPVVRRAIRRALLRRTAHRLPEDAREWLAGSPLLFRFDDDTRARIHRLLATSPSPLARACRAGDAAGCWAALRAAPAGDDPWTDWYGPEERRYFALELGRPGEVELRRACRAGSDAACLRRLRRRGAPPDPLSPAARGSVLALALEVGGAGALRRFSEPDSATPRARLIAASGLPGDSLVTLWRNRVLASEPDPVAPSGGERAGALFWIVLLGFLSTRSTRWR